MGRAHLKYELRSAFHSWGEGIQDVFGMDTRGKSSEQLKAEIGKRELELERKKSFLEAEIGKLELEMERRKSFLVIGYVGQERLEIAGLVAEVMFRLTNNSGRRLKSFKGRILLYDQFGDSLEELYSRLDTPLAPDESITVREFLHHARTSKLLETTTSDVRIEYRMDHVIYADGTEEVFK